MRTVQRKCVDRALADFSDSDDYSRFMNWVDGRDLEQRHVKWDA